MKYPQPIQVFPLTPTDTTAGRVQHTVPPTHQHLLAVVEVLLDLVAECSLGHTQVTAGLALVVHQGTEAVIDVDQLESVESRGTVSQILT